MPRPCKKRRVTCRPVAESFSPSGAGSPSAQSVSLTYDELEALRLADYQGLYQEQAARRMHVSRATFGNIVMSARKKTADFLVNSKRLNVAGGEVTVGNCRFVCGSCKRTFSVAARAQRPTECPHCKGRNFCCEKKMKLGITFNKCWRTQ
ncbi:MAG TPA: DUF134 domain-containing protein [Chitinivibrionales bacterium]|nr:DUF134 domain-containing protein [Chitinivibrionales bacterium]